MTQFDHWAPSYDGSVLQPAYAAAHLAVLGWAVQLGVRPRRILDVGCGTGRLLDLAGRVFPSAELVGVDPSAGMLAAATRGTTTAVRLVRAGAERLPFPDAAFDLVTSTWTVRHWTDRHAGIQELGRVVASGGLCGFADVLPLPPGRRPLPLRRQHRRRIPPWLTEATESAGLRVVGVRSIGGFGVITDLTVIMTRCRNSTRSPNCGQEADHGQ